MKICVAGQGAFGQKHLDALKRIPDVQVVSLIGGNPAGTEEVARKYGIPHCGNDLAEGIRRADAVILATPTQMHRAQGEQVMRSGKHVLIEIPIADNVEDSQALVKIARETGVVAMAGHVRRFNPSHQWVHRRTAKGELKIQQMDVQTYFFRLSLSFNNDGPLGSFFRYICDNGTYQAYYDDLADGKKNPIDLSKVDVSMDGIELEDREFLAAIGERREPNGALTQVLPCMEVLGRLERMIDPKRECVV